MFSTWFLNYDKSIYKHKRTHTHIYDNNDNNNDFIFLRKFADPTTSCVICVCIYQMLPVNKWSFVFICFAIDMDIYRSKVIDSNTKSRRKNKQKKNKY